MSNTLDELDGTQLFLGGGLAGVEGGEAAADELDGLEQPARRLALPDLTEAAAAERRKQPVAGERLRAGLLGVGRLAPRVLRCFHDAHAGSTWSACRRGAPRLPPTVQ